MTKPVTYPCSRPYLADLGVIRRGRHPTRARRDGSPLLAWQLLIDDWPHLGLPMIEIPDTG